MENSVEIAANTSEKRCLEISLETHEKTSIDTYVEVFVIVVETLVATHDLQIPLLSPCETFC